ncbi:MAG: hypothetical protein IH586_12310, partial [Anaerolineaceae bacterium]|nr:hypothetical protein [Anaerolineaceae bacterium]
MNLFSKWKQILSDEQVLDDQDQILSIPDLVQDLLHRHIQLWWSSDLDFPLLHTGFSTDQQRSNEKNLDDLINGLVYELKHIPTAEENRQVQANRLKAHGQQFACRVFNLEQRHLDFIESNRLLAAAQEFARMARAFDPTLSAVDIYQAGRNVMTMNFMQLLLGLPVE